MTSNSKITQWIRKRHALTDTFRTVSLHNTCRSAHIRVYALRAVKMVVARDAIDLLIGHFQDLALRSCNGKLPYFVGGRETTAAKFGEGPGSQL